MRVIFVHGACVTDGQWWWHRAAALLAERGISSEVPLLPSCGETAASPDATGPGLSEDAMSVRQCLGASSEPAIVVAHSYGGIVATEAVAEAENVRQIVFVSSYLPEPGECLATFGTEDPAPFIDVDLGSGTFSVKPEALAETFLQDCDSETQRSAGERLARQSIAVIEQPVSAASLADMASTYVVCAQDRGTSAERQREYARRADTVIEFDAGHHPFLSQPDAFLSALSLE